MAVLSHVNYYVVKHADDSLKGFETSVFSIHMTIKASRDSCRVWKLLDKAQHARRFLKKLFYSYQVENRKQVSISQHTLYSSKISEYTGLWTEFKISSGIFIKICTRNKTETFYCKCIQETAWASVKTT